MTQQVQQFATVQGNITQLLGQDKSVKFIAKSLFIISVGNNDILDHHRSKRTTVSQTQLMEAIRSNFTVQLTVDMESMCIGPFQLAFLPSSLCRHEGANNTSSR